jgi:hypothetical protein
MTQVWLGLVGGDEGALRRLDQPTADALELRAPRASTRDADDVRPMVLGGQIFSAFSESERKEIWAHLEIVEGLILSLHTFFRDIYYLNLCINCVKRLISIPHGVTTALPSGKKATEQTPPACSPSICRTPSVL